MNPLNPYSWVALAGLLAALALGYIALARHHQAVGAAPYIEAIRLQKIDAAKLLAVETSIAAAAMRRLHEYEYKRKAEDAENKQTVAGYERRLVAAAGPARRLRDPNATRCGSGGGSPEGQAPARADAGAGDDPDAGRLLSENLSGLLLRQAKIADAMNIAYASCRDDTFGVRAAIP